MIGLVVFAGVAILGLVGAIAKALAVDETRGQVQRRLARHLEDTIASLPEPQRDEWAEEWRNELAAIIAMPLTAARFVRGIRQSAPHLLGESAPVSSPVRRRHLRPRSDSERLRSAWQRTKPWRTNVAVAAVASVFSGILIQGVSAVAKANSFDALAVVLEVAVILVAVCFIRHSYNRRKERGRIHPRNKESLMTSSSAGIGQGIYGGMAPVTVGSHIIDPLSGKRGTVQQIVGPYKLIVRLEDGTLSRAEVPH
jgi:hypothetical protein